MADWIGKDDEWLNGNGGDRRERFKKENAQPAEPKKGVVFVCVLCPSCGSRDVPVYKTALPTRYHKCRECGWGFKSIDAGA